jgi:adenylylsulfate kinase-like enzyme
MIEIKITGNTNSGKSSIAFVVAKALHEAGIEVEIDQSVLEGQTINDYIRNNLEYNAVKLDKIRTSIKISEHRVSHYQIVFENSIL